ncbi:MAG: hypothetical protein ACP5E5_01450 [Acidobacteriaceae bacterium]
MKACAFIIAILLFANCVSALLAQSSAGSSPAQNSAELLNQWVQKERSLAAKGNAEAQEALGVFYWLGVGVPQDSAQAAA